MNANVLKRGMNFHTAGYSLKDELVTDKYFKIIKDAGFDHVRLPIRGNYLQEGGRAFWEYSRGVCENALKHGLIPMFDMHGYPEINKDPYAAKEGYLALWNDISECLKGCDERIVFELLNEPGGAYTFKILNEIQNECIEIVRKHHPKRLIAAASAHMNTIENLQFLVLPEDENIFVTIHDYTPMKFSHQGAPWSPGRWTETGVTWGSKEEREYMEVRFDLVAAWARLNKRYMHLGEFGVVRTAPYEERVKWTDFVVRLCEDRGIGFAAWDFWRDFPCYDRVEDRWHPEILAALIH